MKEYFLEKWDTIGNPLIYPYYSENTDQAEPWYSTSAWWLWSVNRWGTIIDDTSLHEFYIKKDVNFQIPFLIKIEYEVTTHTPISIKEILDDEYAIPKNIEEMWFSDEVLEQIQSSSFWAAKIYELTWKKWEFKSIVAIKRTWWWTKSQESDEVTETIPEWWLPA